MYLGWGWAAVLALHFIAVVHHFPIGLNSSGSALASGDCGITLGKAWDASRCVDAGSSLGYSPSYMAGYPCGSWNSVGHRGYELGTTYLPLGPVPARYYWTLVGMVWSLPIILGIAGSACGYSRLTALGCAGFGSVVVQLCDPISYFWTFGNAAFPFASGLAVLAVSVALSAGGRIGALRAVSAGRLAGLAIWAHTIAAIPLICGGIAATVVAFRAGLSPLRILGLVFAAVGVATVIVLPGHMHFFNLLGERAPMAIAPLPSGIKYLVFDIFTDRAYRHPMDRRPLFHVLLVFSTWQAWGDWRVRAGRSEGLWLAGILTLAIGYACGHLPFLDQLQPYRFVVSGELFLVVPAYLEICRFVTVVRAAPTPTRVAIIVLGAAFAPSLLGHVLDAVTRERAGPLSPEALRCAEWIRSQPDGGRVLCEPGSLGCLLPHLTNREVIGGGVSNQAVVVQGWTHVGDGRAFGKPLAEITPAEFVRICRLLDVRMLIVESSPLESLLSKMPDLFAKEIEFGQFRIYRLIPVPSADIWEGCYRGKVIATHNRIRIEDPPVGLFTINYHYAVGFRSQSGVTVEPTTLSGVPLPFIAIMNPKPQEAIELTFSSRSP